MCNEKLRVVFNGASDDQVMWGGNDDPRPLLEIGDEYEVEQKDILFWHTKIKLKGVDGWFNDASFSYT